MPFVSTPRGALHYEIVDRVAPWKSAPETIVFHHGIGASAGIFADWEAVLAESHRLVFFDMRGYGRSHVPPPGFDWSLDLFIDDLFHVADAADAERFHFVGESIGGTIGLAAALARPARFSTLTVSNGAHLGASIQRVDIWRRQLEELGEKGWSDIFMRDRFHEDSLSLERRAWFAAQQEKWTRTSILGALGVLIGTDLTPRLGEVRCPVLQLHPDGSPFIPAPIAAEMHRLLPDAELNIFGHARHGLPFSHGIQCAETLREFLARRR